MARTNVAFATFMCVLICVFEMTFSFNFETRLPVIKEGPPNSYFGFSVAEHTLTKAVPIEPFSESVLIVGAPIYQTDAESVKPGGVFTCPFSSNYSDCTLLPLDDPSNTSPQGIKDNQWLGVSVASQGPGGAVAVCAHRYKEEPSSVDEIRGLGKCYTMTGDLVKDTFAPDGLIPCNGITRPDNYEGTDYKYCQAGTDVTVSREGMYQDEGFSEFIMGTPGADNWLGGIATSATPNSRSTSNVTPLDSLNNGVNYNSYLGFSVASAKLKEGREHMYIAGAPRSEAKGAILVLQSVADKEPTVVDRIDAEKPSSSFGYDVATADLNGDGFDDLIVGAPQFFERISQAGGRVYIYKNEAHDGTFTGVEPIKLTGPRDSLFGHALANIGDINYDDCHDIAIGAPYEDEGKGAVYIYLGHSSLVIRQPFAQKIMPSDLPSGLSYPIPNATFGYSLGGGIDLDGNGFPEVTVGAYEMESVVVLRGRPVISTEYFVDVAPTELDPNSTNCEYSGKQALCFTVTFCLSYFSGSSRFDDEVSVNFDIEAEETRRGIGLSSRVVFEDSGLYRLSDQSMMLPPQSSGAEACAGPFNVVIKPGFTDIFRSIPIKISYYIPEVEAIMPEPGAPLPSMTPFPIIDSTVNTTIASEVVFKKECAKDDGICTSDLVVEASVNLEGNPQVLKVGINEYLVLRVSLDNLDEDAYDAKLMITYPAYLEFINFEEASERITYNCEERRYEGANTSQIMCALGNPYPGGSHDSFVVRYGAGSVYPDAEQFNITLESSSTNHENTPDDNNKIITINVESITDILISGSGPEQVYFGGQVLGESAMRFFEDIGPVVNQNWTIFNEGPGAVNTGIVTINFPIEVKNGKWLLYLTHMPYVENSKGSCNVTPEFYVNELGLLSKDYGVGYQQLPSGGGSGGVQTPTRRKRAATPAPLTDNAEMNRGKAITLDCADGTANCVSIMCDLDPLTAEQDMNEIKIVIRARLWNSTFLEDYRFAKSVEVATFGSVVIESAPYITQTRVDNDNFKLRMTVTPDIKDLPPSEPIKWWIILLAVLVGLILLIILIVILWKCGFFERKTGYKYATVTQETTKAKAKKEKTGYYDDTYYHS